MGLNVHLVVDARDPHEQAAWWAETLGWAVEETDEDFIRRMVAEGHASEADTRVFNGRLVWAVGAAIRPDGDDGPDPAQRILFQVVPEEKTVKNRVHWDVSVEDRGAARQALERRGATFLWEGRQGPFVWSTMADPEGNEFCLH